MEERENRKGPGVFYAVIGVATLVVAIIGATFAYFSVTLTSKEGDVTGTTGQGAGDKLTLKVEPVTETTGQLIPMDETKFMTNALTKSCKDDNQNTVCRIYKATVKNEGDSAARLKGTMTLTGSDNMKWQLVDFDAKTVKSGSSAVGINTAGEIVGNELLEAKTGEKVYYLVVWLHETGSAQDASAEDAAKDGATVTAEANVEYNGQVTFSAVNADGSTSGGLTATFSA